MTKYRWATHGIPFVKKVGSWEIDIYTGSSPLELTPAPLARNPVLTANDVSDVRAYFVADPFMLRHADIWYMFFEVLNRGSQRGEISYATSADGLKWKYGAVVLATPFHLSYPYVFAWEGQHYMVPESYQSNSVGLYRATSFPTKWTFERELCNGRPFVDSSPFRHGDRWWMFTSVVSNDELRLYSAETLLGHWTEHPQSPIRVLDLRSSRPAGRIVESNGRLIRFAQDCAESYGQRVRAFEITELTPTTYADVLLSETPVSRFDFGKTRRSHHIDPHQQSDGSWIACGDSFRDGMVFGRRY